MTGDRRLTEKEKAFELATHRFNALSTIVNGGGEPTLFELALIEIAGTLEAQQRIIIDLGANIGLLELELAKKKREGGR